MTIRITHLTYGGRSVFTDGSDVRYYVISRHRTKGNAQLALKNLDFSSSSIIRKYGQWWLVLGQIPVSRLKR